MTDRNSGWIAVLVIILIIVFAGPFLFMGGMMGPGMMSRGWRYQPYGGVSTANMSITKTDAKQLTQAYLNLHLSGSSTEEPDTFYGYYTIHVLRDGKVYGMLSVNGYTGQVWYHTWHGAFIQMKELT